ncbi:MAG: hypothetical protein AAGE96_24920 [Cyanobacteria bacterium P01_G01_bin.19]
MKTHTRFSLSILLLLSSVTIPSPAIAGLFDRPDFFEKGYDEFEEEIRLFERGEEIPPVPLNIEGQTLPWSRIISDSAKFTALFPPGTITQEREVAENGNSAVEFDIHAANLDNSRYVVAYSEPLEPSKVENPEQFLETTQQTIADNESGFRIIANDAIEFDGFPGRQFQTRSDDETFVFRLILVEDRLYVLAVNQPNDDLSEEMINQFFESFQLLE